MKIKIQYSNLFKKNVTETYMRIKQKVLQTIKNRNNKTHQEIRNIKYLIKIQKSKFKLVA